MSGSQAYRTFSGVLKSLSRGSNDQNVPALLFRAKWEGALSGCKNQLKNPYMLSQVLCYFQLWFILKETDETITESRIQRKDYNHAFLGYTVIFIFLYNLEINNVICLVVDILCCDDGHLLAKCRIHGDKRFIIIFIKHWWVVIDV